MRTLIIFFACLAPGAAWAAATISGTVNCAPFAGPVASVIASSDFTQDPQGLATCNVSNGVCSYTLSVPGGASYYIGAFGGEMTQYGPPQGAPIGFYNGGALTAVAEGQSLQADFSIAQDGSAPQNAITSPADNATVSSLVTISGTYSDDIGVSGVAIAIQDTETQQWWDASSMTWVSGDEPPATARIPAVMNGPLSGGNWSVDLAAVPGLAAGLAGGRSYTIYVGAQDVSGKQSEPAGVQLSYVTQGTATVSGVIAAALPDGTQLTVLASTELFRSMNFVVAMATVNGGQAAYTLTLPTPAQYTIGAMSGDLEQGPQQTTLLGFYGGFATLDLGLNDERQGVDFTIAQDSVPPTSAITSPANNSLPITLDMITGTAADNAGAVPPLSMSVYDTVEHKWWIPRAGIWSSTVTPVMFEIPATYTGPPSQFVWSLDVNSGLGNIAGRLHNGRSYVISVKVSDFSGNQQSQPAETTFTWGGAEGNFEPLPAAPKDLAAVYLPAGRSLALFWSPGEGPAPVSYRIYRALAATPENYDVSSSTEAYFEDFHINSGTYVYKVSGVNGSGAEGPLSLPLEKWVDSDPPSYIENLAVGAVAGSTVTLEWTVPADNAALAYYVIKDSTGWMAGEEGWASGTVVATVAASAPVGEKQTAVLGFGGEFFLHHFAVKAYDAAGNAAFPSNTVEVLTETEPPSISVSSPAAGAVAQRPFLVTAEAADNNRVALLEYLVDGATVAVFQLPPAYTGQDHYWDISRYPDGAHVLGIWAYDQNGNMASTELPVTIQYAPPPQPIIGMPGAMFTTTNDHVLVTGYTERGTRVAVFVDGQLAAYIETAIDGDNYFSVEVPLGNQGAKTITAQALDGRGAGQYSAPVTGVYDVGAPGAPLNLAAEPAAGGAVRLTWSRPEGEVPASYNIYRSSLDSDLISGGAADDTFLVAQVVGETEYVNVPPTDGLYYYAAVSLDATGNKSVLSNTAPAVSDREAPAANITLPGRVPPLGAGAYPVRVGVRETLSAVPYLTFTPAGGGPVVLALKAAGELNVWGGTLTVTQAMASGAGKFSFQGTDLAGNNGGEITSGASLLLETTPPNTAASIATAAWPQLKAGAYAFTLTPDKTLTTATVTYTMAIGTRAVALSQTGQTWTGTLEVTAELGEGVHDFAYSAVDLLGNTGTLLTGATYFVVDTLAPDMPLNLHYSLGAAGAVGLAWSGPSGERPYRYCAYMDGTSITCDIAPDTTTAGAYSFVPPAGSHAYKVTSLDAAGNESAPTSEITAVADATPPAEPQFSASLNGAVVTLDWTSADASAVRFRLYRVTEPVSGVTGLPYRVLEGRSATDQPQRDGHYYYYLTALDQAGNESAPSYAAELDYGAAAPEIALTGVADGEYYKAAVQPAWTIYDLGQPNVAVTLNGSAFAPGTQISLPGVYTLAVTATDAGNHSAIKTARFTIDTTPPAITVTGLQQGAVYEAAVAPVVAISDVNIDTWAITLDGEPFVSGSTVAATGPHTLAVHAADKAGNINDVTVAFTLDVAPRKPEGLAAALEDGFITLTWQALQGASGYKLYRDGVYLAPAGTGAGYYREACPAGAARVYEVRAVDQKGRTGDAARAVIPALTFALAGYGNYENSAQALNRGFFDTLRFALANNGSPLEVGPAQVTAGGQTVESAAVAIPAGGNAEMQAVIYTSTVAAATIAGRAVLALPCGGDAALSLALNFNMAVRTPAGPAVELYPEPLVLGAYGKVRVKFNNKGSASADIITTRLNGFALEPSPAVAVSLKSKAGLLLARGEMRQNSDGVSAALVDGRQVYYVTVAPGSSYLFEAIDLAVPDLAVELELTGGVYSLGQALCCAPAQAAVALEASRAVSAVARIPYMATIAPERAAYDRGEQVLLTGRVTDATSGLPLGFKPVAVAVMRGGYERLISTTSKADGTFSTLFTPAAGEAGVFYVSASYPYAVSRLAQSSFTVSGMKLGYSEYTLTLAQNSTYDVAIPVLNAGEELLSGLMASTTDTATGLTITATPPAAVPAGERRDLILHTAAAMNASGDHAFSIRVVDANGFARTMPLFVKVVPAQIIPQITPQVFEIGMLAGETRSQQLTVENIGFSTWTNVQVSTPTLPWVTMQGSGALGDIPPGGKAVVTLNIAPSNGLANASYARNPLFTLASANYGSAVPVNAGITITAARQGNAYFTTINADKTPTDAGRWIGGANVTLTSLDVSGLSFTAKSDTSGLARLEQVPSGRYAWRSEAQGFQTANGNINIEPGLTTNTTAYMATTMVTYKWSVTPTTIQDKYDIKLDLTFRTDVPAPALIIDPPDINLNMEGGQTIYTQFTIKNKGLVSAMNVRLEPAETDPAMKVEYAFTEIAELKPGQSVIVPVKIYLEHASCHSITCILRYIYTCASKILNEVVATGVKISAGSCVKGGTGGGENTTIGNSPPQTGSARTFYTVSSVVRGGVAKSCSSSAPPPPPPPDPGGDPNNPIDTTKPGETNSVPLPDLTEHPPLANLEDECGSLSLNWQLYYDALLKRIGETSNWIIEELPNGSLKLTDENGAQIIFAPNPDVTQQLAGSCPSEVGPDSYGGYVMSAGGEKTILLPDKTIKLTLHDGVYQPDRVTDRKGTYLDYKYNLDDKLESITDIHGRQTVFGYDGNGNKTSATASDGRHISMAYDAQNRLIAVTDVDGSVTNLGYDTNGRISQYTFPNGSHRYYAYDSKGKATEIRDDDDVNKQTFQYLDVSSTVIVTDVFGRQTFYEYFTNEGHKEVSRVRDPLNQTSSFKYDKWSNRTEVTDPLGRVTKGEYTRSGRPLSLTDAAGNTTIFVYDHAENDPNDYPRLAAKMTNGGGECGGGSGSAPLVTVRSQETSPNLINVTDALGHATLMDYDGSGNMAKVTDAQGNVTEMGYDNMGHMTMAKDPLGHMTFFEYNNLGALSKISAPMDHTTTLTRDNSGNIIKAEDPKGLATTFEYDVNRNLTQVLDAMNGVTRYTYTRGGDSCPNCGTSGELLGTVTDARNQTTTFNYDKYQRLTSVVNPVGNTKRFEYDQKSRLTKVTDAKGQVFTYDYDENDRLTVRHLPEGDVTYTYDGANNLTSVTAFDQAAQIQSKVEMTYGILNQVIETKQLVGGQAYTISYAYDALGNRTHMTGPWANGLGTTHYTYDSLNRLTSLTNPDGKTINFEYDAIGRRTKMTYPNGIVTTYAYDAASQVIQILARKTADDSIVSISNYGYDKAGNRTSMQDLRGYHNYGYDNLHRLISASHPSQPHETFAYDAVGNRTSDNQIAGYQYNQANRLLSNSRYNYTYDANGNQTGKTEIATNAHTAYAYNSENQLKQVTLPDNTQVTFKYDPLGRRIEKINPEGTTRYVYDNEDIIATLDNGNALNQNITHGPGIDEPLILKKADTQSNYYYHCDGLGSITALTNDIAETVETYEYQVYGKTVIRDYVGTAYEKSTVGNFYLFTSREYDDILRLYYYRARTLSPEIGIFIQEDPIRFASGDTNIYRYVLNNPINYSDSHGESIGPIIGVGLMLLAIFEEFQEEAKLHIHPKGEPYVPQMPKPEPLGPQGFTVLPVFGPNVPSVNPNIPRIVPREREKHDYEPPRKQPHGLEDRPLEDHLKPDLRNMRCK